METALKEVFSVHRNVVRGLRMQLHQVTQERDELKQKLGQSHEQLEEAVFKLKEETCFLHSVIKQFREEAFGCQCVRSSEQSSSPILPSNKHQEATQILEEQFRNLVQILLTVSQQMREACSREKASHNKRKLLVNAGNREQNQDPDQGQDIMRANTQTSQQNQPRESSQAARIKADKLLKKAEKVDSENKVNLHELKCSESEDIKSNCLQKPKQHKKATQTETDCLLAGAASLEERSDRVAVTLIGQVSCRKGVDNQTGVSQKSPEQGSKLQLLRHTTKRRRYTEEDDIRKQRRLYTTKSAAGSEEDMCPSLEVPVPNRPLSNHTPSHSQRAQRQNKASHHCAGGKTLPQTRQTKDVCHAEEETHQDTNNSSIVSDHGADEGTAVDIDSPMCGVPETLGMDLFATQTEMETGEKSTAPSSAAGEIEHQQDKKQKTRSSSADSKAKVKVACDGGSVEICEKTQDRKESGWPTDSVVFGSAGPRLAQCVVPEPGSTSSLSIEEGHKEADRRSPVFLTHRNQPHANMSPTLFDDADSDKDSEECISSPPVVILTWSTIHKPDKQCAAVEKPAVSPVSPLLLQPPQHTGWIAPHNVLHTISKSQTSSPCVVVQAGKRRVSVSQTLQAAKDATSPTVSESPQHPENSSAHGTQTNMTQSAVTVWNPAPRKKLFKAEAAPALPSADDTINPCLLDCTLGNAGGHKAIADPQSWQGNPATLGSQLNASLDPAVRLTQYLQEPTVNTQTEGSSDEMCELPQDQEDVGEDVDVTLDPRFQRLHQTSGQDVTLLSLSMTSQAHTDCQLTAPNAEEERPTTGLVSLDDSFDRVPQKKEQSSYAFAEVVRKQAERKKLKAFVCWDCEKYYRAMGLAEGEARQRLAQCSRHRARQALPSTPEHFWSIGFPDTPECEERQRVSSEKNRRV